MVAKRILCTLLTASVALSPVAPARADMISTQAAVTGAHGPRDALFSLLSRPEVAGRLAALGVEQRLLQERVAAVTDAEALALATELNLPAGGDYGGGGGGGFGAVLVIVLLIALLIWWVNRSAS